MTPLRAMVRDVSAALTWSGIIASAQDVFIAGDNLLRATLRGGSGPRRLTVADTWYPENTRFHNKRETLSPRCYRATRERTL